MFLVHAAKLNTENWARTDQRSVAKCLWNLFELFFHFNFSGMEILSCRCGAIKNTKHIQMPEWNLNEVNWLLILLDQVDRLFRYPFVVVVTYGPARWWFIPSLVIEWCWRLTTNTTFYAFRIILSIKIPATNLKPILLSPSPRPSFSISCPIFFLRHRIVLSHRWLEWPMRKAFNLIIPWNGCEEGASQKQ